MKTYFLSLADRDRSERGDRHLAYVLAFVAGGVNAGGFMAVHQYTSHMSGMISSLADNLVLGNMKLVGLALGAIAAFISGAATSAILINWAKRRNLHSQYALPLALEAALFVVFAGSIAVSDIAPMRYTLLIVVLLCYVMGLQNAMITKLSGARIRTTHVTGMVTDVGIEFGKLLYRNGPMPQTGFVPVRADLMKLQLLLGMIGLFFSGGICGALLFALFGLTAALVFAVPLTLIAVFPLVADVRANQS